MGVREAGLEPAVEASGRRRGGARQRLRRGQEGEVAVEGAAGAAEVGEAETLEVAVSVVVAARVGRRRHRVRAPLDHPERERRAGEVVAAPEGAGARSGAGEDVDASGEAGGGG